MRKFYSIQYLRAIAALAVVLFHAAPNDAWEAPLKLGAAGVDIFFVISGFIIWTVTSQKHVGIGKFIWNRIVRLVPLYWTATLLLAAMVVMSPASFPRQLVDWPHLLLSLAFVAHANPLDGSIMPVVAQGWTLTYEVFFYAVFAVSLLLQRRVRLIVLVATLALLAATGFWLQPQTAGAMVYTNTLLLEFALGLGIARLSELGWARQSALGFASIGLGIAGFALSYETGFIKSGLLCSGVPAALLVYGALSIETILPKWRLPERLGTASYSIYIWHGFVIAVMTKLGLAAHLPQVGFIAATLIASSIVGVISYAGIEAPSLRWLKAMGPRMAGSRAAPQPQRNSVVAAAIPARSLQN